jgi:archaellum component FlaF (FlaF/FlaG flagellin family)
VPVDGPRVGEGGVASLYVIFIPLLIVCGIVIASVVRQCRNARKAKKIKNDSKIRAEEETEMNVTNQVA